MGRSPKWHVVLFYLLSKDGDDLLVATLDLSIHVRDKAYQASLKELSLYQMEHVYAYQYSKMFPARFDDTTLSCDIVIYNITCYKPSFLCYEKAPMRSSSTKNAKFFI